MTIMRSGSKYGTYRVTERRVSEIIYEVHAASSNDALHRVVQSITAYKATTVTPKLISERRHAEPSDWTIEKIET